MLLLNIAIRDSYLLLLCTRMSKPSTEFIKDQSALLFMAGIPQGCKVEPLRMAVGDGFHVKPRLRLLVSCQRKPVPVIVLEPAVLVTQQQHGHRKTGVDLRRYGGLGLFMVKNTMDGIDYVYRDGRNVLTLRKKI